MKKLRLLYYLLRILKSPTNYYYIETFRRELHAQGYFAASARFTLEIPENRPLFLTKELFSAEDLDITRLRQLPQGTLGRAFVDFLERHGLEAKFYQEVAIDTDGGYFHRRNLETHDIWHTALGIGPDPFGEMKIQGFMYAQMQWPTAPFYLGAALAGGMLKDPTQVPKYFAAAVEGYNLGKRVKPLFAVRWQELWAKPLTEVREMTQIASGAPPPVHEALTGYFKNNE